MGCLEKKDREKQNQQNYVTVFIEDTNLSPHEQFNYFAATKLESSFFVNKPNLLYGLQWELVLKEC